MANKNYNKMSKPNTEPVEAKVTEETTIEEKPVTEKVSAPKRKNDFFRVISKCNKLNVRKGPGKEYDVEFVLDAGTRVKVISDKSVDDWYFISCPEGNGYCMKLFTASDS